MSRPNLSRSFKSKSNDLTNHSVKQLAKVVEANSNLIKHCLAEQESLVLRSLRISARRQVSLPEAPNGQLLSHALSIIDRMTGVIIAPTDVSTYHREKNAYALTFFSSGKDTPLGRILSAKKRPYVTDDGQTLNIGLDAQQTKKNHNIFRFASYQKEIGLLHSVRVCFSTRLTSVRPTASSEWKNIESLQDLPGSLVPGTPFNSVEKVPQAERKKVAAANRAKAQALLAPVVKPSHFCPSPRLPLDKLQLADKKQEQAMDTSIGQ